MPQDKTLQDILNSTLCPSNIFGDTYPSFIDERVKLLVDYANQLIKFAP
ncbi:MAG: hypothetical protein SWZ49_31825 [Cyanobacteriota bacterium]|nr:hypothetical protein [Cyanobacteriota bacterium]